MLLVDALNQIVDEGIEAARADYTKPRQKHKLEGAIKGFEDCRGKDPAGLAVLRIEANADAQKWYGENVETYWYWRCRALEVEWVCNVLSAILANEGRDTIVPPTCRGVMKASEIVGVAA